MKLTLNGIKEHEAWENAGIQLPGYDVEKISAKAKEAPVWVHFGIGNIFRVFIGGIADHEVNSNHVIFTLSDNVKSYLHFSIEQLKKQ